MFIIRQGFLPPDLGKLGSDFFLAAGLEPL